MCTVPVRVPLVTKPRSILQSLALARHNVLSIIPDIATRQPMVSGKTGKRWHMAMDADAIRRVVLERLDDYPKSDVTKNLLRPAIGESLFVAEGAHWRWQRRATAPAFSHRNVAALAPLMTAAAERSAERIAAANGPLDLMEEMTTTTFDVISDVTFSGDTGFARDAVHRAIDDYLAAAARISLFDLIGMPNWVPRPGRLLTGRALREMKQFADRAIDARAARDDQETPDLLDLLLGAEDPETGRALQTGELRDNLLTFIVAGHETTALTLAWALYLCAFDQDVQTAARQEAQATLQGRAATAQDIGNLPLTRQIIDETLRLYPPAGLVSRTALKTDTLGDREIRPGDTVMIPIYALHRSHLYWDDPDAFNPARFAQKPPRFTYFPFGDGPRICIGASFALQEAVIVLATLLSRFQFTPVKNRDPKPVMILTLRPEGGVWLNTSPA